jgi:hypothetical protein
VNKFNLIIGILAIALLYGCAAPPKPMYYWGEYSQSLYSLKKNSNAETADSHLKVLDDIMLKSKEMDLKVPPGICAEYGYYMLSAGKKEEAKKMFQTEKDIYPESTVLMDRMIKSIN